MYKVNKKVILEHVFSKSYYVQANLKSLPDISKGITPSITASSKLINSDNINKNILRNIISVDPTSSEWTKSVKEYWNSIYYIIPSGGKELEVGFLYNKEEDYISFKKQEENIINNYNKFVLSNPSDDDEVIAFKNKIDDLFHLEVEKNRYENNRPIYGTPLNSEEYLIWLYCQYYAPVAKRIKDVDKSVRIKYILTDELENKMVEEQQFKLQLKADEQYPKVVADSTKVDYILKVLHLYSTSLSEIDKKKLIKNEVTMNPKRFLATIADTNLESKVFIEDLISANLIKRLKDSSIIVDYNDNGIIIGNSTEEAITFFDEKNTVNKAQASEYVARLKSLKKIK